jgi:23S rRNA (cytidine1920-2'-O)/16S rRNA (cytidine1409-2'-O)-methyltransferase
MTKIRLDQAMVDKKLVQTRSQAENYIKLGQVSVNGRQILKAGYFVNPDQAIQIASDTRYVSRAALKLASAAGSLGLDFKDKIVLDVGSSTGGFSDYALKNHAQKVIAVDVGTDQMHADLRNNPKIELHEKTDIRSLKKLSEKPDIVLIDVSFISLRQVLPHIAQLVSKNADIVAMVKPQFEANGQDVNKGVIKNDTIRRKIFKDFEAWAKNMFKIVSKADSEVAGAKGNLERFYLLRKVDNNR